MIASPAFASLRKKVSATPCMLGYIDTAGVVRDHYGMAVVAWGILANAQAGRKNGVMLPTSPRLAELLGQQVSAISLIGTTVVFEEYGSLPLFGLGSMPGGSPLGMLLAKPESVPLSLPSGLR